MSASDEFPEFAIARFEGGYPWYREACGRAIDTIAALRARVVVAEEALVVAHEDADRLHDVASSVLISVQRNYGITPSQRAKLEAAVDAHRVAVSSRPKADPT